MNFENVFVTVGTTKFDKLIHTLLQEDTLTTLKEKQCRQLIIQIGQGEIIPEINDDQISLTYYRFKNSIQDDIKSADLVISHAGAGTCLDVLEHNKPLISVINDDLMHNHQTELANKLDEDSHCVACTCNSLVSAIKNMDSTKLIPFEKNNDEKCASLIEKFVFFGKIS